MGTTLPPLQQGGAARRPLFTIHALVVTALALALCLVTVKGRLDFYGGDPSYFILACEAMTAPDQTPPPITLTPGGACYDGVAYYRLALDPFTTQRVDFGLYLDKPAYRQQRILYPLLAWTVTKTAFKGDPAFVPWVMIGLNVLAAAALCAGAAALLQQWRKWPYWALLVLAPGIIMALARSCGEVISLACLVWGVAWLTRERCILAAICLSLAVLARETAVLFPLAALGATLAHPRERGDAWRLAALLAPLVTAVALQTALWLVWGVIPVFDGGENLGTPFLGLSTLLQRVVPPVERGDYVALAELSYLALLVVAVAVTSGAARASQLGAAVRGMKLAFWGNVALGLCLTHLVWVEDWAYMRTLSEGMVLGLLLLFASNSRWAFWLRLPVACMQLGLLWVVVDRAMRAL